MGVLFIVLTLVIVVFVFDRPLYYYYRTVVMINLAFALVVFMGTSNPRMTVASPFDIQAYFVDTIQVYGPAFYGSPEMAAYYNTSLDAAMPSLHFSWTVILGVLFVRWLKGWLKLLGLAYPVMTLGNICSRNRCGRRPRACAPGSMTPPWPL